MKKRILFDCLPLSNQHNKRGIGIYVDRLNDNFNKLQHVNINNILNNNDILFSNLLKRSRFNWLLNPYYIKKKYNVSEYKIIHFTDPHSIFYSSKIITIATIYDLIPLIYKKYYFSFNKPDIYLSYLNYLNLIKKMDHLIAISETTKHDFIKYLGINENKISVVPLAGNDVKHSTSIINPHFRKFFLYVGGFEFRKNIDLMLESFAVVKDKIEEDLILIGNYSAIEKSNLNKKISGLKIKNRVFLKGFVKDNKLNDYYKYASAFIFLSKYEGFGIPIFESMGHKTPTIILRNELVHEIFKEYSGIVKFENKNHIANILYKVSVDKFFKKQLIHDASKIIKTYSWSITAKKTYDVYCKFL